MIEKQTMVNPRQEPHQKVDKEVKKKRGTSLLEKFKVRAPVGHHRDYILLLFVELARKSTLVCFLFK